MRPQTRVPRIVAGARMPRPPVAAPAWTPLHHDTLQRISGERSALAGRSRPPSPPALVQAYLGSHDAQVDHRGTETAATLAA